MQRQAAADADCRDAGLPSSTGPDDWAVEAAFSFTAAACSACAQEHKIMHRPMQAWGYGGMHKQMLYTVCGCRSLLCLIRFEGFLQAHQNCSMAFTGQRA